MDKYKQITLVFVVALFLRIFLLGSLPIGFHADEVRAGWNAYSVLKTGMDDRGNLLALYYNTFGDYRPTGIFYTIIPSIKILGLNEFAVRFPSALFGAMTVFPLYFIAHVLTRSHKISIISAIFLALSPWHISVSRSTSEAVISMFFALAALSLLLHAIKFSRPKYVLFFTFLLALSYFFYHSVRLLAPLFVIVTAFHFRKEIRKSQLQLPVYLSIIVLLTLTFTLVVASAGRERLTQISIARSGEVEKVLAAADTATIKTPLDSKFMVFTTRFINEYSKYFTFEFLVGQGKPVRYASPDAGLITYVEVFFLIAGVVISIQKRKNGLLIIFLLLAPLPAALTSEDSPNLHRSLFMVPFIAIFAAETVLLPTLIGSPAYPNAFQSSLFVAPK